jgi:hypothetical protein
MMSQSSLLYHSQNKIESFDEMLGTALAWIDSRREALSSGRRRDRRRRAMHIYTIRRGATGSWAVYDIRTNEPAKVGGHLCVGLSLGHADELADLLNFVEEARRSGQHR